MFEFSSGDFERPPYQNHCKRCKQFGFEWSRTLKGWRLVDCNGNVHSCQPEQQPSNDQQLIQITPQ